MYNARPVRRRRLVDAVIEEIEQDIALGHLGPGDRLPTEVELTERLGVSRTTVREAVGALAHAGLLDVRQGDGTYVLGAGASGESLERRLRRAAGLEVYEVRRALELEAARLAAGRRTASDLQTLRAALVRRDEAQRTGDLDGLVGADLAFHTAIAAATRNAVLADLYRAFAAVLRDVLVTVVVDPATTDDTGALHHALAGAIERSDGAEAVRLAEHLLDIDARRLASALRPGGG